VVLLFFLCKQAFFAPEIRRLFIAIEITVLVRNDTCHATSSPLNNSNFSTEISPCFCNLVVITISIDYCYIAPVNLPPISNRVTRRVTRENRKINEGENQLSTFASRTNRIVISVFCYTLHEKE